MDPPAAATSVGHLPQGNHRSPMSRLDAVPGMTQKPAAKATYVRKTDRWKIYWQRADLKWHA
jgi:hypothetical protein